MNLFEILNIILDVSILEGPIYNIGLYTSTFLVHSTSMIDDILQ